MTPAPVEILPPAARGDVERRLERLEADRFGTRLWRRDPGLWSAEPGLQEAIAARLGWLGSPARMRRRVAELRAFAREAADEGFSEAVLLGMGGSSMAPEVLRRVLGVAPRALELTVLDDTSPAAVRAVADAREPARTLFVVSSKSGTTIEVASFERFFFEWVRGARGDGAGRAFVAITDPGTPLDGLARERGYRRAFLNSPDIGGRYSALSYFGLVPAALVGADLEGLLAAAAAETATSAGDRPAHEVPGVVLGAALGELARGGRDKVTLALPAWLAPLGAWIEQLLAESTGKVGRGLVPVAEEELAPPEAYGDDRVFVAATLAGADPDPRLEALAAAGHPVLRWTLPARESLGAEFLRWEIASACAGAVLEVNPFDEPNVTEAKQATQTVLEGYLVTGRFPAAPPLAAARDLEAHAAAGLAARLRPHLAAPADPAGWAAALPALARPGDYLALLAYFRRTPARHERLQRLRHALRAATRLATTLGYGPRYLHSTGQMHKGGPDTGVFLQLTADEGEELAIPGERFGFGALQRAQAAGDYAALERRGRRLLRVHLGGRVEAGLDALIEAVAAASRV